MTLQFGVHFLKEICPPFSQFLENHKFWRVAFWALILNNGLWDWHLQRCTRLTLENLRHHLQLMVSDKMKSLPTLLDLAPTWPTGKSGRVGGTQQIRCWTIVEILPLIQKRELLTALYIPMSKHPAYNVNRTFNGNYAFSSQIT